MITVRVDMSVAEAKLRSSAGPAAEELANHVAKDTEPFVPFLNGDLTRNTKVIKSRVIYPGPYARYLYYGKRMVNAKTGKGPRYIKGVGYRWPRGANLRPTDEPLHFTTKWHPQATAQWFEVSKAQNLDKWKRVAGKAIEHYGR